MPALAALALCLSPVAIDGDTLKCAGLPASIRITGIDAPEMPGHCRKLRVCAPGDPYRARAAMRAAVATAKVEYRPLGIDRYKRTIAAVYADGVNVSCMMVSTGNAIYKPTWDKGKITKKECGL